LEVEKVEGVSFVVFRIFDQTILVVNLLKSSLIERNDNSILWIVESMAFKTFIVSVIYSSTINVSTTLLPPFISPVRRILMNISHFSLLVFKQYLNIGLTFNAFVQRSVFYKSIIVVIDE